MHNDIRDVSEAQSSHHRLEGVLPVRLRLWRLGLELAPPRAASPDAFGLCRNLEPGTPGREHDQLETEINTRQRWWWSSRPAKTTPLLSGSCAGCQQMGTRWKHRAFIVSKKPYTQLGLTGSEAKWVSGARIPSVPGSPGKGANHWSIPCFRLSEVNFKVHTQPALGQRKMTVCTTCCGLVSIC